MGLSFSHNGKGAFAGGHRGPRSFSPVTALQGNLAQQHGGVSPAGQLMPGIAAEPPGAMSHLPSLSTGVCKSDRRWRRREACCPSADRYGRDPLLQMVNFLAMAAKALALPCIIRQAEGSCNSPQASKIFRLARARTARPGIALHSAMASCG